MDASHPDTFSPEVVSLPKDLYESMVRAMRLPPKGIETTAVVGPFFWSAFDDDDGDPHLRESGLAFLGACVHACVQSASKC